MSGMSDLVVIFLLVTTAVVSCGLLLIIFKSRGSKPLSFRFRGLGIDVHVGPHVADQPNKQQPDLS